jgi:hypothetical protein
MRVHSLLALVSRAAAATFCATLATAGAALAAAGPWNPFQASRVTSGAPRVVSRAEAENLVRTIVQQRAGGPAALARMSHFRPPALPDKRVKVAGWVVDNGGYLWGIDQRGNIKTYHSDCKVAGAGRVDHAGNLVVACGNGGEFEGIPANVNVYKRGNTSGAADVVLTDTTGDVAVDAFEDNAGDLYVVNLFQIVCGSSSCDIVPGNVQRWSVGNQRNGALPDTTYSDPNIGDFQSGDIDAGGTIYVSGTNVSTYAPEVDTIRNGVSTNLGITLDAADDVYVVSPNGSAPLLSVVDGGFFQQPGGTLYQFALPVAPGAQPIFTDPTPQNRESSCNPVGAGYGPGGTDFLVAITNCQAFANGREAAGPGHWKVHEDYDFISAQIGLPVPSDK